MQIGIDFLTAQGYIMDNMPKIVQKDKLESAVRRVQEMRTNKKRGHVTVYISDGEVKNYEVVEKH